MTFGDIIILAKRKKGRVSRPWNCIIIICRAYERDSKGTVFLWSGQGLTALVGGGATPHSYKAHRKGEFQKQSSGLFLKEGRPASEGVP